MKQIRRNDWKIQFDCLLSFSVLINLTSRLISSNLWFVVHFPFLPLFFFSTLEPIPNSNQPLLFSLIFFLSLFIRLLMKTKDNQQLTTTINKKVSIINLLSLFYLSFQPIPIHSNQSLVCLLAWSLSDLCDFYSFSQSFQLSILLSFLFHSIKQPNLKIPTNQPTNQIVRSFVQSLKGLFGLFWWLKSNFRFVFVCLCSFQLSKYQSKQRSKERRNDWKIRFDWLISFGFVL